MFVFVFVLVFTAPRLSTLPDALYKQPRREFIEPPVVICADIRQHHSHRVACIRETQPSSREVKVDLKVLNSLIRGTTKEELEV